jgi:hypothetical protein
VRVPVRTVARARARDSQWLWPRAASRAVDVERRLGRPDVYRNRRGASSARSAQPQSRIAAPPRRRRESREEMRTPESQCVCMDAWMEMCAGWDGVAWTAPHRPESSVAVVRSVESTREMGHAARGRLGREACKTLPYATSPTKRCTTVHGVDTRPQQNSATSSQFPFTPYSGHGSPGGGGGAAIK